LNQVTPPLTLSRNVPNAITAIRVALTIIIAWLLYRETNFQLAGLLLILAALTDWLDGYLARRLAQASLGGSLLDMVADQALFISSLLLAVRAGRFSPAEGLLPANPYPYVIATLAGGVAVLAGILTYLWKRRHQAIEFPTPTKVAKVNFWFWLAPLMLAVLGVGPGWLLAGLMYAAILSTIATFFSYLKKGSYVFTR
jgi:phosphatidylglycerophosphate synthase